MKPIQEIRPAALQRPQTPYWPNWAVLSYAFRPFYLLASIFGIVAILMWTGGFLGVQGMREYYWHAHEMIWGYTSAIVFGFLLTAVVNWTGVPTGRGWQLILLVACWFLARTTLYIPHYGVRIALGFSIAFYLGVAYNFARPIMQTKNKRNYMPILIILLFGLTQVGFDVSVIYHRSSMATRFMYAGLLMIVGFISLITMRVVPFFTARRLGVEQRNTSMKRQITGLIFPVICAISVLFNQYGIASFFAILIGINLQILFWRTLVKGVWKEPMLWVLFAGIFFVSLGAPIFMLGKLFEFDLPIKLYDLGIHFITVGGIAVLTLGMMARTALGHTGRPMRAIPPMPWAFRFMIVAAVLRMFVPIAGTNIFWFMMFWHSSATCFCIALILFLYRYAVWLCTPPAS